MSYTLKSKTIKYPFKRLVNVCFQCLNYQRNNLSSAFFYLLGKTINNMNLGDFWPLCCQNETNKTKNKTLTSQRKFNWMILRDLGYFWLFLYVSKQDKVPTYIFFGVIRIEKKHFLRLFYSKFKNDKPFYNDSWDHKAC